MSKFYCVKCQNEGIPIERIKGRKRASGHLKKLWCLHCQDYINHVEIQEFATNYNYDDFMLEITYGNFDDKQNRIMDYGLFKNSLNKKGLL